MSKYTKTVMKSNEPQSSVKSWANLNAYTTTTKNNSVVLRLECKSEDLDTIFKAIMDSENEKGYISFTLFEKAEFAKDWQEQYFSVGVPNE